MTQPIGEIAQSHENGICNHIIKVIASLSMHITFGQTLIQWGKEDKIHNTLLYVKTKDTSEIVIVYCNWFAPPTTIKLHGIADEQKNYRQEQADQQPSPPPNFIASSN